MTEEEALLAVAEPHLNVSYEFLENYLSDDSINPFKLKKCFIRLSKLPYIESALKMGCQTILLPTINL